jgi:hypothetical protein
VRERQTRRVLLGLEHPVALTIDLLEHRSRQGHISLAGSGGEGAETLRASLIIVSHPAS